MPIGFRAVTPSLIALVVAGWPLSSDAANLKPEAVQAWNEYLKTADARLQLRLDARSPFLWIDEAKDRVSRVQNREIVVAPADPHMPRKVPFGLIHHWLGGAFLPSVNIADVMSIVRDYGRYKDTYRPHVIDSSIIALGDSEDRFSVKLMNKGLFQKTAIDGEYRSSYVRLNDHRSYTVSESTRLREIADYGSAGQHTLPDDEGTGLIWRLYSVTRMEERDGGLYIEVEAMALSRDIPASLRWVAEPIIRRVSRDSITTALRQTGDAACSAASARLGIPVYRTLTSRSVNQY
jgi:hypothetical protein